MTDITLYHARKILTMDPRRPEATHVAVKDGRILAVGDADCAAGWGAVIQDNRFQDAVLMPGLVEGHSHMMAGAMWRYAYAGFHDRIDPDGRLWSGMTTIEEVIAGLTEFERNLTDDEPLVGWGFDPIFLTSERLNKSHLDLITSDRPIAIIFSNFHLMCVNSKALEMAGYTAGSNAEGVIKGADGEPTGELQEMAAMFPIMRRLGIDFRALSQSPESIRSYGAVAKRAGVTTVTDLYATIEDEDVAKLITATSAPDFPVRIVPALGTAGSDPHEMAQWAIRLRRQSTDKLRMGAVKLMTDGSIQGWTARVRWPGYVDGQPNGLWNTPPEQIFALCQAMQQHGVQMHIHVNGDEAAAVSLDALEAAMQKHTWPSARHVLQHCQMMDAGLFQRSVDLGVCCNVFSNHIWFFGDRHVAATLGPNAAARMNAVRTALDLGVHTAIHSDAPVTPLGPLFTAWCAVNRQTMSGATLGAPERITVPEALRLITMGAAYTLRMDTEIGSIEPGKIADFAVLGEDPLAVDPIALKDVPVLGTVSGGVPHLL